MVWSPILKPFDGIGVAAILDMLIEWATKGSLTTITRWKQSGAVDYLRMQSGTDYPAFKIPAEGVDIYDLDTGYPHPLIRLHTKTGRSLWLMKENEPELRTGTEPSGPVPDDHHAA